MRMWTRVIYCVSNTTIKTLITLLLEIWLTIKMNRSTHHFKSVRRKTWKQKQQGNKSSDIIQGWRQIYVFFGQYRHFHADVGTFINNHKRHLGKNIHEIRPVLKVSGCFIWIFNWFSFAQFILLVKENVICKRWKMKKTKHFSL